MSKYVQHNFILIILLLLAPFASRSQKQYIISINELLGENLNIVYEIKQDKKGFIWITSDQGLIRFDGYKYKSYTNSNMSSKAGAFMQFDNNDQIWYTNFDGEFYAVMNDSLHKVSLPNNSGLNYFIQEDTIWYIHQTTLIKKRISTLETIDLVALPSFRNVKFSKDYIQLHETFQHVINFYTLNGHFLFKREVDDEVYPQLYTHKGNHYIVKYSKSGLDILQYQKDSFTSVANHALQTFVNNVIQSDNLLHICSKSGLFTYNIDDKSFTHTLKEANILSYFMDTSNNEWIATSKGIYLKSSGSHATMVNLSGVNHQLHKVNNQIWLSDQNGHIIQYDYNNNQTVSIYDLPNQQRIYTLFTTDQPKIIQQLFQLERIFPNNTFKYNNTHAAALITGIKDYAIIDNKYMATAMSGSCDFILLADSLHTSIWDTIFNQHLDKGNSPYISSIINSTRGKSIAYDSSINVILVSTNTGLFKITPNYVRQLNHNNKNFYADKIIAKNGKFLLLSNNGELFTLDKNDKLKPLYQFNAGKSNYNLEIHKDQILVWNMKTIQIFNINDIEKQPIPTKYITAPITTKSIQQIVFNDSLLFMVSGDRLITIPYLHESKNTGRITLIPEYIKYDNEQQAIKDEILIPSNSEDIELHFSIIDLNHNVYELSYQINGGEWRILSPAERSILFASLAPDEYTINFRINGEVQDTSIKIIKENHWYNSWWFYIGLASTIIFIIIQYFNNRFRIQAQENKLQLEKRQLENDLRQSLLSSIKSQMNPHFLFNALNTIQSYIITEDKENASRYLSMYSRLTRNILEMSDKEYISLEDEVKTINLYVELERMRFPDIEYQLTIDPNINTHTSFIPSMIIQPFIENAIKHGLLHKIGDKKLIINIQQELDDFKISILDNGIGRTQSAILNSKSRKKHQSFATKANLKRVELLHLDKKDIVWNYIDHVDASNNPLGTELILIIPIKYMNND